MPGKNNPKTNEMFETDTAERAFEYIAKSKSIMFYQLKIYLGTSIEDAWKAVESLEKNKLVYSQRTDLMDALTQVSLDKKGAEVYAAMIRDSRTLQTKKF